MANTVAERYPGEEHFVDGYVPQSMNAEYSSLHRTSTWAGMGLILASLAAWGTFIFGAAVTLMGTHSSHEHGHIAYGDGTADYTAGGVFQATWFMWGGLIVAICMVALGMFLIHHGRKAYREYVRTYGGHH